MKWGLISFENMRKQFLELKKKENGNKNGGTASEKKKMTIRLNWPKNDNNNNRINL